MENIEPIERRLWEAADQLRANSKLTSTEYYMPVLGLIFLRHAFNRFLVVKEEVEKNLPKRAGVSRPIKKDDFVQKSALFLREKSRFDYLLNLPSDKDRGQAIFFGERIRKDILKEKRAEYGERILPTLSAKLEVEFGSGFSQRNLASMVRFAEVFPDLEILHTMCSKLSWSHFRQIIKPRYDLQRNFINQLGFESIAQKTLMEIVKGFKRQEEKFF